MFGSDELTSGKKAELIARKQNCLILRNPQCSKIHLLIELEFLYVFNIILENLNL